ncbi:MAG: hypothetical protein ACE5I1_04990, partial [bacterium]
MPQGVTPPLYQIELSCHKFSHKQKKGRRRVRCRTQHRPSAFLEKVYVKLLYPPLSGGSVLFFVSIIGFVRSIAINIYPNQSPAPPSSVC